MMNAFFKEVDPRQQAFRELMQSLKCPFRTKTVTRLGDEKHEEMMPCDPDCVALINKPDYSAYSCLRLTQTYAQCKDLTVFHGLDKEEK